MTPFAEKRAAAATDKTGNPTAQFPVGAAPIVQGIEQNLGKNFIGLAVEIEHAVIVIEIGERDLAFA